MIINIIRKPLIQNVCENIALHNTGSINVDQTRIPTSEITGRPTHKSNGWKNSSEYTGSINDDWKKGRWPANVLISEKSTQHFPQSLGWSSQNHNTFNMYGGNSLLSSSTQRTGFHKGYDDSGSASRYFKVVKEND